jgi:hypothetical protein
MGGDSAPVTLPAASVTPLPSFPAQQMVDLREAAKPPSWTVNQPQKSWPMVGAGGATAGVEGPDFPSVTPGLGNLQQQLQSAGNGAGEAGSKAAGDFGAGFLGQLEETVAKAGQLIEQLRGMMDFSASPRINAVGDSSPPQRSSSLTNYDHGRASGHGGVTIGQ